VFSALASPVRRDLLRLLLDGGPQSVQDLAARFDMRRPSVSEHLRVLREAGLVVEDKRGRRRYYRLELAPLQTVREWLAPYELFWRHGLADFAEMLDQGQDQLHQGQDREE
jgi:DNA-binding transcriptional ArsR family regulator